MTAPPKAIRRGAAKPLLPGLPAVPRRERLTITVSHRGGAESWWELRARGRVWRRPGWMALEDVLADIYDGYRGLRE